MISDTPNATQGIHSSSRGTDPDVSLLLIPVFVVILFLLPFAMAKLEPKKQAPTHRATSRRPSSR